MSNLQAIVNLKPPSEAYFEATCSLVYRLSELMFGSLLAAYSLGFVGAIAAHGNQLYDHGFWGTVLLTVQYASISIAFAYLTTSFYLTYHVGILTMPQLPFDRLGIDFTISVVQAVFFGLSMLQPAVFPLLLGINFYISAKRKDKEYERLADSLYDIRPANARQVTAHKSLFRQELAKLMQNKKMFPEISAWAPTGLAIRISTWTAVIIGLTVIGLYRLLDRQNSPPYGIEWLPDKWFLQQYLIVAAVVCATVLITIRGSKILEQRASFLGLPIKDPTQKRPPMDTEFDRLKLELANLCNKLFSAS